MPAPADPTDLLLRVRGTVQGVGFRPFVHRTATRLSLRGWVRNDSHGVLLRVAGPAAAVAEFTRALHDTAPPAARVQAIEPRAATADDPPVGDSFAIVAGEPDRLEITTAVPCDLALCADCRRELLDPHDRRHRYPFINCTQCGPRYSIIEQLPYDRPRTTMRVFAMCPACQREYDNPSDRRFHAEPNACPVCGPRLSLSDPAGAVLAEGEAALQQTAAALRAGRIVAVKGLGGFHLMCDATSDPVVAELRRRKHREEKPLAVMFCDLDALRAVAEVSDAAAALLLSPAAPIVLVPRRSAAAATWGRGAPTASLPPSTDTTPPSDCPKTGDSQSECHLISVIAGTSDLRDASRGEASQATTPPPAAFAAGIAPGNPWIGALLPYAPLHVLLLGALDRPVVATSANLSEEPLCTDDTEARQRLAGIADLFLGHNRAIARPVDDSVVRLASDARPILLRRARGYAPAPLTLPAALPVGQVCDLPNSAEPPPDAVGAASRRDPPASVADRGINPLLQIPLPAVGSQTRPAFGPLLCVGAQMKNTIAVAAGDRLVLSPHLGDLENAVTRHAFEHTIETLSALHGSRFAAVACDKHPDYSSTHFAEKTGLPRIAVQHHLAHVLACLLEHGHPADGVLGIAWDGTGYGEDGTVWGGEFILLEKNRAFRFGRLRRFRLPGGEAAVRDARRVALGLAHELGRDAFAATAARLGFSKHETVTLATMLARGLNSPVCSSGGRLFDAVGALLGLGRRNTFEGQTPLAVEAAAATAARTGAALPFPVRAATDGARCEIDWAPAFERLSEFADRARRPRRAANEFGSPGLSAKALATAEGFALPSELAPATADNPAELAAAFHRGLAAAMVEVARRAGVGTVALTGGCFQNALLHDLASAQLTAAGFRVLTHRELPPNDGSIAAGQALGALWNLTTVE